MTIKFILSLFVSQLLTDAAVAQYAYKKNDLARIYASRKQENAALKAWNRQALWSLGQFYERIYDQYKDSSMNAAVRCYTSTASSDGDYLYKEQSMAALKLASVFEQGKGVKADIYAAMVYYFLAGREGAASLERLKQDQCQEESIIHRPETGNYRTDSLVIAVSPFCNISKLKMRDVLHSLSQDIRFDPSQFIRIRVAGKYPSMPSPYNLWAVNTAIPDRMKEIISFFTEVDAVPQDNLIIEPDINWDQHEKGFRIILSVLKEVDAGKLFATVNLEGTYSFKDDFCGASFIFSRAGEFYYTGGCEDRSSIAKGRYTINGNSIQLQADTNGINYSVKQVDAIEEGKLKLRLTDMEDKPLANFSVFILPAGISRDTIKNMRKFRTDQQGELQIDAVNGGSISFTQVNPGRISPGAKLKWEPMSLFSGKSRLLQFNFPASCLRYPEINFIEKFSAFLTIITNGMIKDHLGNRYKK